MPTNVSPKSETEIATETGSDFSTIMNDATIVADKTFTNLMGKVDTHQKAVGGKWFDLIAYCKGSLLSHLQREFSELSKEEKEELKRGKAIVLKSLGNMGKTESSAQSIRSYIIKMCKPENAETLAKLQAGEITVRASREAGRTPQSGAVQRSNTEKYAAAVDAVVRYARSQGFDSAKIYADIGVKFAEYEGKDADKAKDSEKAAKDKAEFQQAIAETEKQLQAKS